MPTPSQTLRAADLPFEYNAVAVLEHNLAERADAPAVFTDERTCTFGEVSAEVDRVGHALRRSGVRAGDRVGLLLLDSVEWVAAYFATLKVGGVALSLNTLLTASEHADALRETHVRLLFVHEPLLSVALDLGSALAGVQVVVVGDPGDSGFPSYAEWSAADEGRLVPARTERDEVCSLNYSSGTTGQPKGIPHAHKDLPLTADLWGKRVLGLGPDDRTFGAPKLFFTFGTGGNLIFPFFAGASCVLFAGAPRVPENLLSRIDRFRPTVFYNAPTGYGQMLAVDGFAERYDLSSLRACVSAGEALPAPLWQRFKDATGLEILDGIGSTENYHIFLSNRPGDIRPGSSGKPVPGYEVRIVDDDERDVAPGEVGSLWVKGETAALRYLNRYEASRRVFRGPWLVTGDKYRVDEDGYYWHAGRSDDLLKVGGIWVSPVEVESTLLEHEAVLECAVVGHEDDRGLVKPRAFVVVNNGASADDVLAAALISHCRGRAAAYKRPRWIEFVDELPKTATGKIQRFKLRS